MLTSQAFRDTFPLLPLPHLKAAGALLKDSPCSFSLGGYETALNCLHNHPLWDHSCDTWHRSFHPDGNSHSFHSDGNSHIRNSVWPTFHLLRISHIRHLSPDGRGGRFNFPGQTYPDPSVTLIRRTSVANDLDSPDSLVRQILAIRQIHFRPQSKSKLRQY